MLFNIKNGMWDEIVKEDANLPLVDIKDTELSESNNCLYMDVFYRRL